MSKMVDITAHKAKHLFLHRELDELIADFIFHNKKGLTETTIMDLVEWSYQQTINPTEED